MIGSGFIVLVAVILWASHNFWLKCKNDWNFVSAKLQVLTSCSGTNLITKNRKTLNEGTSGGFYHVSLTWDCCIVLLIPWCPCSLHVVVLHHCTDSLRHTLKMVTIHSMHHPPSDWVKIQLEMLKVLSQHTYHCDTTVNNRMSINWSLIMQKFMNL
jgi:hypothetical protein